MTKAVCHKHYQAYEVELGCQYCDDQPKVQVASKTYSLPTPKAVDWSPKYYTQFVHDYIEMHVPKEDMYPLGDLAKHYYDRAVQNIRDAEDRYILKVLADPPYSRKNGFYAASKPEYMGKFQSREDFSIDLKARMASLPWTGSRKDIYPAPIIQGTATDMVEKTVDTLWLWYNTHNNHSSSEGPSSPIPSKDIKIQALKVRPVDQVKEFVIRPAEPAAPASIEAKPQDRPKTRWEYQDSWDD
jgi:hypothetical protein